VREGDRDMIRATVSDDDIPEHIQENGSQSQRNCALGSTDNANTGKPASIGQAMLNGVWGRFKQLISCALPQQNNEQSDTTFRLPNIVVIGQEASGKSSVLESITKCAVFPRDKKQCTGRPVRVKLQPADKFEVQVMDDQTAHGSATTPDQARQLITSQMPCGDTVQEEELHVTVSSPDVPELELVDLPGIREYPPEPRETTKWLVQTYISQTDSIVLCVVPATSPRVTGNQAIGMIKDASMQSSTVIALTMVDQVESDDIEPQIIDRVRQCNEEDLESFAACVGVANRKHTNRITLEEAHDHDQKTSHRIKAATQDGISLENLVGVQSLIWQVMRQFDQVMRSTWKPKALSDLQAQEKELHEKLQDLGEAPEEVNANDLANIICAAAVVFWEEIARSKSCEKLASDLWMEVCHSTNSTTLVPIVPETYYSFAAASNEQYVGALIWKMAQIVAGLSTIFVCGQLTFHEDGTYSASPAAASQALHLCQNQCTIDPSLLQPFDMCEKIVSIFGEASEVIAKVKRPERFVNFAYQCAETALKHLQRMNQSGEIPFYTWQAENGDLGNFQQQVPKILMSQNKQESLSMTLTSLVHSVYNDKARSDIMSKAQEFDRSEDEATARQRAQLREQLKETEKSRKQLDTLI